MPPIEILTVEEAAERAAPTPSREGKQVGATAILRIIAERPSAIAAPLPLVRCGGSGDEDRVSLWMAC